MFIFKMIVLRWLPSSYAIISTAILKHCRIIYLFKQKKVDFLITLIKKADNKSERDAGGKQMTR